MNNRKNAYHIIAGICNMLYFPYLFVFTIGFMMEPASLMAQNQSEGLKTETIKVWGNCESCKQRIEKAAKVDGVTKAVWDIKTKMLTLTYDPKKVTSEKVQKQIAAVGHDTEKFKADDKAYNSLPGCCKYERRK